MLPRLNVGPHLVVWMLCGSIVHEYGRPRYPRARLTGFLPEKGSSVIVLQLYDSTSTFTMLITVEVSLYPGINDTFIIMAIRSASPIHYARIQAKSSGFVLGAPTQGAECGLVSPNNTQFTLDASTGDVYLYTPNTPEQAVVDRSGMGQGHSGYTNGVAPIGTNQECGPFVVDEEGSLVFNATNGAVGFQVCPGAVGGGYSVWLAGATDPGGNKDCIPLRRKRLRRRSLLSATTCRVCMRGF
jgi:hypothetical protein